MLQYLAVRCFDNRPLFLLKNGTPLSRQGLVEKIKMALAQAGVDSSHYSGNSFRIGAATTAAACSVSDATIQLLGKWKSDCYTRYFRPPHQELATTSSQTDRVTVSSRRMTASSQTGRMTASSQTGRMTASPQPNRQGTAPP